MTIPQPGTAPDRRPRIGTAGRLLGAIALTSPDAILDLAHRLGADPLHLTECSAGTRPMSSELQMQLAALVVGLLPEHARSARRLYAQAQAALRVEASGGERHLTYPREHFR